MKDLKGKVSVVTGGASGIGLGIARALARAGTHVLIADIQKDKAAQAAAEVAKLGVRTSAFACDVSNRSAVEKLADQAWSEFGHVDLIFNNAGVMSEIGPLIDASEENFRWLLEVNVLGVWLGCAVFGKRFQEQGTPAHIINTGSEHSLYPSHPFGGFYTATKHAILALSDVLRLELPDFIQVSILCPGLVSTELARSGGLRPERFGGPAPLDPAMAGEDVTQLGMSADDIGERAIEGVRRGDFYIVTHPHNRPYIEDRYREILTAFEIQAPHYEGDEVYDVRKIMVQMMGKQ
jgi:NAD(P)-dependent dehydrogenase (short-subunit alcohol dehydrogenase family)